MYVYKNVYVCCYICTSSYYICAFMCAYTPMCLALLRVRAQRSCALEAGPASGRKVSGQSSGACERRRTQSFQKSLIQEYALMKSHGDSYHGLRYIQEIRSLSSSGKNLAKQSRSGPNAFELGALQGLRTFRCCRRCCHCCSCSCQCCNDCQNYLC